ncbi:hypothetical protein B0O99DRAFT_62841 [Bisporella sp. PMI_857]|nr:hypothetical protein B0O99DRAFT_62841 [Bisporella sp. PMI_857]
MWIQDLYTEIKWEYKFIKRAPKEKRKEHEDLRKQLTNMKKSLRTEMEDAHRKNCFFQIHDKMTKKQLQRHLDKRVVKRMLRVLGMSSQVLNISSKNGHDYSRFFAISLKP